jgi:hypothetical protein
MSLGSGLQAAIMLFTLVEVHGLTLVEVHGCLPAKDQRNFDTRDDEKRV